MQQDMSTCRSGQPSEGYPSPSDQRGGRCGDPLAKQPISLPFAVLPTPFEKVLQTVTSSLLQCPEFKNSRCW